MHQQPCVIASLVNSARVWQGVCQDCAWVQSISVAFDREYLMEFYGTVFCKYEAHTKYPHSYLLHSTPVYSGMRDFHPQEILAAKSNM